MQPHQRKQITRGRNLYGFFHRTLSNFSYCQVNTITLDSSAKALCGDSTSLTAMRTKIRQLYDMANIFSSINLIEKTHHPESRKLAFRWLGWRAKPHVADTAASYLKEQKKRTFGDDITNYSSKKRELMEENTALNYKDDSKVILAKEGQDAENLSKGFVFGPLNPFDASRRSELVNKNGRLARDWENLATTYRPHYQNTGRYVDFDKVMVAFTTVIFSS